MSNTFCTAGIGRKIPVNILSCCLPVLLAACRHNLPEPIMNPGNNGTSDTGVCFERDVQPIFITYCTRSGCHDDAATSGGYAFTSYSKVVARGIVPGNAMASLVYKDIANGSMPWYPNPQLNAQQKSIIAKWISEGAKNTSGCMPECDSDNTGFATGVQPLMTKYCVGCHSSHSAAAGVTLENYQGVFAVAMDGRLMGSIRHENGYTYMPGSGKQLSVCEIRQVEKWLTAGAQNN
ncbi:hypothetical protein ACTHGU_12055 [Chitinophagaceae bacterium MMS25-I14]